MGELEEKDECAEGEALLELFARGTELTRQLLDETARLRRRLVEVSSASAAGGDAEHAGEQAALRDWIARIDELRLENRGLLEELQAAESRNQVWAARHAEIEERHNDLANLYVASYQLHASFDPDEVIAAISEIVINLIGAEVFALYSFDTGSGRLRPVACEGRALGTFPEVALGDGVIGGACASGALYVAPALERGEPPEEGEPVAVVPLSTRGRSLGAIALYKLFDQKAGLSELDRQLFGLLASHAASALLSAHVLPASLSQSGVAERRGDRITN